jgi:hypothetical protein
LCLEPVAQRVQLRGDGTEHLGRAARHGHMHLLAADVHERGASIKDRQIAHVDAPIESRSRCLVASPVAFRA